MLILKTWERNFEEVAMKPVTHEFWMIANIHLITIHPIWP
jgi:preprotein translocase subunit Sss1